MLDFLVGNDLLSAVVAFILVLIPAVLIHELGHFFAAKAVGITILEFGIGLPPRMLRLFTFRGTEYTLNWLPLGGFVRPLGEDMVRQMGDEALANDRKEALERGIEKATSVNEAKPLARILFMAGGALANFVMALVIFFIVGLIGIPQVVGGRVIAVEVAENSALAQAGLQANDVIEEINGEKFADANDFIDRLYALDGEQVTLDVLRPHEPTAEGAEPEIESLQVTFIANFSANQPMLDTHPIVLGVAEGSPADRAGMLPRDLITTFDGQRVPDFETLREFTQANLDNEVELTLLRGDETLTVRLTPRSNPPEGQGSMGITSTSVPVILDAVSGFRYQEGPPQEVITPQPLGVSIQYSFYRTGDVLNSILSMPAQIIRGTVEPEAARPVSVVGIGQLGGVFLQESVEQDQPTIILNFIAVINIALGLTNLLPLPALDGGRIMFVLLELVRGKPIAPEREGFVHLVGLALLLSAMVVLVLNDLINPVTNLVR